MADFQVMPALTPEEYATLKADIADRGIIVPVVVDQHGRTLDGHHRQQTVPLTDEERANLATAMSEAWR